MAEQMFSQQELRQMEKSTLEKLKEAINAGDAERATELADELYNGFTFLHDGYMCWISGLLTFIYEHHGVEQLAEAEKFAHTIEGKIAFPPLDENMGLREVVQHTVGALHGHVHQPMSITEDEEKITITVDPCGSGGRLMEMGGYGPGCYATVKEKVPLTYGEGDMPIYCVHCPAVEMLQLSATGRFKYLKPSVNQDGSARCPKCEYVFYKDPAAIPGQYYARIGLGHD